MYTIAWIWNTAALSVAFVRSTHGIRDHSKDDSEGTAEQMELLDRWQCQDQEQLPPPFVGPAAGRAFTAADTPALFALREYLASVYPAAAGGLAALPEAELHKMFQGLDYFYHCETDMFPEWRQQFACRSIDRCGKDGPSTAPPLPYLPSGAFYKATLESFQQEWAYTSRTPVSVSDYPTTNSFLRAWVAQKGVFQGPAPSWTNPLSVQRYVWYPNGFSREEFARAGESGVPEMPWHVQDRHLNLSRSLFPAERYFKDLKDGDFVEVEQSGGPFIEMTGLWGNVWRGTGIFMRAATPLVSWNKLSALSAMLRRAEREKTPAAGDGARLLLDWFIEAFGLQQAVLDLRQYHRWEGSRADLVTAAMISIGHPCGAADHMGRFNFVRGLAYDLPPTDLADQLFADSSKESGSTPLAFGTHWLTGLCGRGPLWSEAHPWRSWDHALSTLASNLGVGTVILAASSNDNRLISQEFLDVDFPEELLVKLRRPDLHGEFVIDAHAERVVEHWVETRKFQQRPPPGVSGQPLPCDLSGLTRSRCGRAPCWVHCRGAASQSTSEVPLGKTSTRYHDIRFLQSYEIQLMQLDRYQRLLISGTILCVFALPVLLQKRASYAFAFAALLCFGGEHFMIGDSVSKTLRPFGELFMPVVFTAMGIIGIAMHLLLTTCSSSPDAAGSTYSVEVRRLAAEFWTPQGRKRLASVAMMGAAVVLAQTCCRRSFGRDMSSIGASQAVVCCDTLLVSAFFWLVFGEPVSRFGLSCMALITGGLVLIGMASSSRAFQVDSFLWSLAAMALYGVGIISLRLSQMCGLQGLTLIVTRLFVIGMLGFMQLVALVVRLPDGLYIADLGCHWKLALLTAIFGVTGISCVSRAFELATGSEPSVCVAIFGSNSVAVLLLEFIVQGVVPQTGKLLGMTICVCGCSAIALEPVLKAYADRMCKRLSVVHTMRAVLPLVAVAMGATSCISIQFAAVSCDPALFTFVIEVAKLAMSQIQLAVAGDFLKQRHYFTDMAVSVHLQYFANAATFNVQNIGRVMAIQMLGSTFFECLGNMKIICCAFVYQFIFRRLTRWEWLSLVILTLAILEMQLSGVSPALDRVSSARYYTGFAAVSVCCLLSGVNTVMTEYVYKAAACACPLPAKNSLLYFWSAAILLPGLLCRDGLAALTSSVMAFDPWLWAAIFLNACNGISIGYVLMHFDSTVKQFLTVPMLLTVAVVESAIFHKQILSLEFFVGLLAFLVALQLFTEARRSIEQEKAAKVEPPAKDARRPHAMEAAFDTGPRLQSLARPDQEVLKPTGSDGSMQSTMGSPSPSTPEDSSDGHASGAESSASADGHPSPRADGGEPGKQPGHDGDAVGAVSRSLFLCVRVLVVVITVASLAQILWTRASAATAVAPPTEARVHPQRTTALCEPRFGGLLPSDCFAEPLAAERSAIATARGFEKFDPIPTFRTQTVSRLGQPNLEHYNHQCLVCQAAEHHEAQPAELGLLAGRQLLLDGHLLAEAHGVRRALEPAASDSVALEAALGDETGMGKVGGFGCPCNVVQNGTDFLLYYRSGPSKQGLAVSADGIRWQRVVQPLEFQGFTFPPTGDWCILNDVAARDPRMRFKAAFNCLSDEHEQKDLACIAASEDGVTWKAAGLLEGLGATDTYPCLSHAGPGEPFEIALRENFASVKNWRGVRGFKHVRLGLDLDSLGPHLGSMRALAHSSEAVSRWYFDSEGKDEPFRRQVYSLTRTAYGGMFIGLANVLSYPRLRQDGGDELQAHLATSRDGVHWDFDWVYARKPLISNDGDEALPRAKWVENAAQIITHGGHHLVIYDRNANAHEGRWFGVSQIHVARFREGRMAGLRLIQGRSAGDIVTRTFTPGCSGLSVDVRATGSGAQVVVEAEVPGAHPVVTGSRPLRGVDGLVPVSWRNRSGVIREGVPMRLRFALQGPAVIFGFSIRCDS